VQADTTTESESRQRTPLNVAIAYYRSGLTPIPIPFKSKNPAAFGWEQTTYASDADLAARFNNGKPNIGILNDGTADVDCDCSESIYIAGKLLPPTPFVHGRASKPRSHYRYRCDPSPETARLKDVTTTDASGKRIMTPLVELLSTGTQTVAPGSTHESGEEIRFSEGGIDTIPIPTDIDGAVLVKLVHKIAALSILARHWPGQGGRHDAALALAGGLTRAGWALEDVVQAVRLVAEAGRDDEVHDRVTAARTTFQRIGSSGDATGWPRLAELIGEKVVGKARKWLGAEAADLAWVKPTSNSTGGKAGRESQPPKIQVDAEPCNDALADAERFPQSDHGNGEWLMYRHGQRLRFVLLWNKPIVFDGRRWLVNEGEAAADQLAVETLRHLKSVSGSLAPANRDLAKRLWNHAHESESNGRIKAMLERAAMVVGASVLPDKLDADPWALNVLNGTLDLRTGELRPHRMEDFITRLVPVNYSRAATAPTFLAFLQKILNSNPALIGFVQRAFGYSLTGITSERALFVLHGCGANGKSTLLGAMRDLLTDYAAQTRAETLMVQRKTGIPTDIARLKGARMVSASESDEGRRLAESLVKEITGGEDVLVGRFLYSDEFEFKPTFKLFLATNHRPEIRGTDDAIWDRIKLVPFDVTIPPEERNKDLPQELRAELPGILAWAVQGCLVWQRDGLGVPVEVRQATCAYREDMDWLGDFIEEKCIEGANEPVAAAEIYAAYKRWCELNGAEPINQNRFGRKLAERGFKSGRDPETRRKNWTGIGLKPGG
jgi:putative DNA primase/helicase